MGIEIDYSMKAVSDLGKYSALSEGMTVQMYYDTVVQDVGCKFYGRMIMTPTVCVRTICRWSC